VQFFNQVPRYTCTRFFNTLAGASEEIATKEEESLVTLAGLFREKRERDFLESDFLPIFSCI